MVWFYRVANVGFNRAVMILARQACALLRKLTACKFGVSKDGYRRFIGARLLWLLPRVTTGSGNPGFSSSEAWLLQ
jgi:hypothetical protein